MIKAREWVRENSCVSGSAFALVVCLAVFVGLRLHLTRVRGQAAKAAQRLNEMRSIAGKYDALKAGSHAKGSGSLRAAEFNTIARKNGIRVAVQGDRTVARKDGLTERLVDGKLIAVRREQLKAFLNAVRNRYPATQTTFLEISPSREQPDRLDARVQFSSYEPAKAK